MLGNLQPALLKFILNNVGGISTVKKGFPGLIINKTLTSKYEEYYY